MTRLITVLSLCASFIACGSGHTAPTATSSQHFASAREYVTSDRTYYVSTSGNDSADGLTISTAFRTWQKAIDTASNLDIPNGRVVTIEISDGTYTDQAVLKTITGGGRIVLKGNPSNRDAVTLNVNGKDALYPNSEGVRGLYEFRHFRIMTSGSGNCILIENAGMEVWVYDLNFSNCADGHVAVLNYALLRCRGDYAITGSAPYHLRATHLGRIACQNRNVTLTGSPDFNIGFVFTQTGGTISVSGNTFNGSATGRRWYIEGGEVHTNSTNSTYLPGNAAGVWIQYQGPVL